MVAVTMSLEGPKTIFRLIIHSHSSANPENLAKFGPEPILMELLLILIKLKNCFYIVHVRLICVIKFYLLTYSLKVDFEIVGVTGIVIK